MHTHYWRYQLAGWLTLLGLDFLGKFIADMFQPSLLVPVIVLYGYGLFASHGLRYVYKHHLRGLAIWKVLPLSLLLSLLAAFLATSGLMAVLFIFGHPAFAQPITQPIMIFQYNLFLMWLFLFIWTGLYLFITRQRQVDDLSQQHQELQNNLEQSQLHALLNQLNPHFMFNCINNIRALILEDSHKARDMLAHMADMLRYNLQDKQQAQEVLKIELDIAHAFMQLASIQFEQRLCFSQHIQPKIDLQVLVPRMLIQLLLENAVKHGIAHLPQGGEVSLHISCEQQQLRIEVSNDGLLQTHTGQGIGLQNIRSRLKMLYGDEARFDIIQQGSKVVATTLIPMTEVATCKLL